MYLMEEAHVACVGGDAFGDPGCIRLSYATSDENIQKRSHALKKHWRNCPDCRLEE